MSSPKMAKLYTYRDLAILGLKRPERPLEPRIQLTLAILVTGQKTAAADLKRHTAQRSMIDRKRRKHERSHP